MKKFTRKQLIKKQTEYNKRFRENPSEFGRDLTMTDEEIAILQIDFLLSLTEENEPARNN